MSEDNDKMNLKKAGRVLGAIGGLVAGGVIGDKTIEDMKAPKRAQYVEQNPEIMAQLHNSDERSPQELASIAVKKMREKQVMTEEEKNIAYNEFLALYTAKQRADAELEESFINSRAPIPASKELLIPVALMGLGTALAGVVGNELGNAGDNALDRRRKRKHARIAGDDPDAPKESVRG